MIYAVQFLETAVEELAELPQEVQRQILKRIEGRVEVLTRRVKAWRQSRSK